MAGLAHAAVGLVAKPLVPEVNVGWLILGTFVLDILWIAFWCVGLERPKSSGHRSSKKALRRSPWSG